MGTKPMLPELDVRKFSDWWAWNPSKHELLLKDAGLNPALRGTQFFWDYTPDDSPILLKPPNWKASDVEHLLEFWNRWVLNDGYTVRTVEGVPMVKKGDTPWVPLLDFIKTEKEEYVRSVEKSWKEEMRITLRREIEGTIYGDLDRMFGMLPWNANHGKVSFSMVHARSIAVNVPVIWRVDRLFSYEKVGGLIYRVFSELPLSLKFHRQGYIRFTLEFTKAPAYFMVTHHSVHWEDGSSINSPWSAGGNWCVGPMPYPAFDKDFVNELLAWSKRAVELLASFPFEYRHQAMDQPFEKVRKWVDSVDAEQIRWSRLGNDVNESEFKKLDWDPYVEGDDIVMVRRFTGLCGWVPHMERLIGEHGEVKQQQKLHHSRGTYKGSPPMCYYVRWAGGGRAWEYSIPHYATERWTPEDDARPEPPAGAGPAPANP